MNAFWSVAEKFPPVLVRLLARHRGGPPFTTQEIAERSGGVLSDYDVVAISHALSWDAIPFKQMRAFLHACDCDFCSRESMNRKSVYLKTPHKFRYLRRSPEWATVLQPLARRFREEFKKGKPC